MTSNWELVDHWLMCRIDWHIHCSEAPFWNKTYIKDTHALSLTMCALPSVSTTRRQCDHATHVAFNYVQWGLHELSSYSTVWCGKKWECRWTTAASVLVAWLMFKLWWACIFVGGGGPPQCCMNGLWQLQRHSQVQSGVACTTCNSRNDVDGRDEQYRGDGSLTINMEGPRWVLNRTEVGAVGMSICCNGVFCEQRLFEFASVVEISWLAPVS